jgi:hypothetical protein
VAVEIPEDLVKIESGRIGGFRQQHMAQNSQQGARPLTQHRRGGAPDLTRHGQVCGGEIPLFSAQPVLFLYGADEEDKS